MKRVSRCFEELDPCPHNTVTRQGGQQALQPQSQGGPGSAAGFVCLLVFEHPHVRQIIYLLFIPVSQRGKLRLRGEMPSAPLIMEVRKRPMEFLPCGSDT